MHAATRASVTLPLDARLWSQFGRDESSHLGQKSRAAPRQSSDLPSKYLTSHLPRLVSGHRLHSSENYGNYLSTLTYLVDWTKSRALKRNFRGWKQVDWTSPRHLRNQIKLQVKMTSMKSGFQCLARRGMTTGQLLDA